jgi:hypothetical protein
MGDEGRERGVGEGRGGGMRVIEEDIKGEIRGIF